MNNIEHDYLKLLHDILNNGVKKQDRTGTGTISVFGRQIRHDMRLGFPLLTTKKMPFKTIVTELLWFLRGDTNIKFLVDNNCHIWDGDAYKNYLEETQHEASYTKEEFINLIKTDDIWANVWGELGPVYGAQWRKWSHEAGEINKGGVDQIANLINDLKTNPDSRRLIVNAWNVGELNQMVLPPCHFSFQCYSHEKEGKRYLSLAWNQRSCDVGLGIPFNIASYGLLLEIIAKEVNMVPYELIGNLGDCHIYNNHIEIIKEQLNREPYLLPKLIIDQFDETNHYVGDMDDISEYNIKQFKLENYQSHLPIKLPLSN
jgi:thymidylate synthase